MTVISMLLHVLTSSERGWPGLNGNIQICPGIGLNFGLVTFQMMGKMFYHD